MDGAGNGNGRFGLLHGFFGQLQTSKARLL
jgi:hypothetical protein